MLYPREKCELCPNVSLCVLIALVFECQATAVLRSKYDSAVKADKTAKKLAAKKVAKAKGKDAARP